MYYTLDLPIPPIPAELLVFTPRPHKTLDTGYGLHPGSNYFSIGKVQHIPLRDWIINNIPGVQADMIKHQSGTQGRHVVHTDVTRVYALNYLINTGGSNVVTSWYQERGMPLRRPKTLDHRGMQSDTGAVDYANLDCLASVQFAAGVWALIATDILHDVQGIETTRNAITVSIGPDELDILDGLGIQI